MLKKTFKNPNIVDIKIVITEHPKSSHKLFKTEKHVLLIALI